MRARRLLPVLLVLAAVAVGATGCFESKVANTTISGEITVGEGSTAQTVNPAEAGSTGASTQASTEQGSTGEEIASHCRVRMKRRRHAAAGDLQIPRAAFSQPRRSLCPRDKASPRQLRRRIRFSACVRGKG